MRFILASLALAATSSAIHIPRAELAPESCKIKLTAVWTDKNPLSRSVAQDKDGKIVVDAEKSTLAQAEYSFSSVDGRISDGAGKLCGFTNEKGYFHCGDDIVATLATFPRVFKVGCDRVISFDVNGTDVKSFSNFDSCGSSVNLPQSIYISNGPHAGCAPGDSILSYKLVADKSCSPSCPSTASTQNGTCGPHSLQAGSINKRLNPYYILPIANRLNTTALIANTQPSAPPPVNTPNLLTGNTRAIANSTHSTIFTFVVPPSKNVTCHLTFSYPLLANASETSATALLSSTALKFSQLVILPGNSDVKQTNITINTLSLVNVAKGQVNTISGDFICGPGPLYVGMSAWGEKNVLGFEQKGGMGVFLNMVT